jgi:hypothetical protein
MVTDSGLTIMDLGNFAGLDSNAIDGYDIFLDNPEPPNAPSNYIALYFPHPEWNSVFGDNFSGDFRNGNDNLIDQIKTYIFQVSSDQIGDTLDLEFIIGVGYTDEYGIVLHDLTSNSYQNIREDDDYNFTTLIDTANFELNLGDGTAPIIEILFPIPDTILYQNVTYDLTWEYEEVSPIRYSKVYFSLDNGLNWTIIDSISGSTNTIQWNPPDTTVDNAKLKIEAEDWAGNYAEEVGDFNFIIEPPLVTELTVSIEVNDIILNWEPIIGAQEYRIYYQDTPYFYPSGIPQTVVLPPDTSWTDVGALNWEKRFYRIIVEY